MIYHMCRAEEWQAAKARKQYQGSSQDAADGFIHFSTAAQAPETARRHFARQANLVVLAIEADDLGAALKWEPSRGGDLFPHLYGPLDARLVRRVSEAPLGEGGVPVLDLAPQDLAP